MTPLNFNFFILEVLLRRNLHINYYHWKVSKWWQQYLKWYHVFWDALLDADFEQNFHIK